MLSSTSVIISVNAASAAVAVDELDGSPMSPGAVGRHGTVSVWPGAGVAHDGVSVCPASAGRPNTSVNTRTLASLQSVFMFSPGRGSDV